MSDSRALSERERAVVKAARSKAFVLYQGDEVPHRSCGIAVAETFGLPTRPYQSLRRGGITGRGTCGAVRGGEQVLGELLGDPDPTGAVTDELRAAITWYQERVAEYIAARGAAPDLICDHLTAPHGDFRGRARHDFCTDLAARVAELTAEALVRFAPDRAARLDIEPVRTSADSEESP